MGQHHPDDAAVFQVQVHAAGVEQLRHILVAGVAPAGPDAVVGFALRLQFGTQHGGGAVVAEPGRVADECIHPGAAQRHRAHQVAGVISPDVVAPGAVQGLQSGEGFGQRLPLGGVGDVMIVQRQQRVVAGLNIGGGLRQQGIEGIGAFHQADGKDQLGDNIAVIVLRRHGNLLLREQVAVAEA